MGRVNTTEALIEVSQKWWGDRLDYSATEFTGALNKVRFTCKVHGEFTQVAYHHVQGTQGCLPCRAEKIRDEFIQKALGVWGEGTFDYSEVVPGPSSTKVLIRCISHDITFEQTKSSHLQKFTVCPECRGVLTTRTFIEQATEVWGDRWDYSNSQCFGKKSKVSIICRDHGEFTQLASTHLEKKVGCPGCASTKRLTQKEFLRRVEEVWGDRWDVSKAVYINNSTKVILGCRLHGDFTQKPISLFVGGVGCPKCNGKGVTTKDLVKRFQEVWGDSRWDYSSTQHVPNQPKIDVVCPQHGEFSQAIYDHLSGHVGCPSCRATKTSKPEQELIEFIRSLGVAAEHRVVGLFRSSRREVDVYVPEYRVAFEFNGLYYHSELFRSADEHFSKVEAARKEGITLFHVWEDDWRDRPLIVQEHIRQVLGVSSLPKISARSTQVVVDIPKVKLRSFLGEHHIQGYAGGSISLGLEYQGELVAVAVFKKRVDNAYELVRYATSANVRGGHSKLVSFFEKTHSYQTLITFADLSFGHGELYYTTGWVEDAVLPPDYSYVYKGRRVHKFNFRKARFRSDSTLKYDEDMTERELALLNNIPRIYDAGKIRFVKPHPLSDTKKQITKEHG